MKLCTEVIPEKSSFGLSLSDKTSVIGSCFADSIGRHLEAAGFDVLVNPFGTLYNPASIASAIGRLDSGEPFVEADCVEMGAGAGLICSFEHHTSFARPTKEEFLENANRQLSAAEEFWKKSTRVIITLGTAFAWKYEGKVVSNCLKRPSQEFTHDFLSPEFITSALMGIVARHPEKKFIFTVSPKRYMGAGAHLNTISKSILQLCVSDVVLKTDAEYFPAFEILLDELRDYRFYAADMQHPSDTAVQIIWEKFVDAYVPDSEKASLTDNEKAWRRSQHRPMR